MKIVFQKIAQWENKPSAENELAQRMLQAVETIDHVEAISSSSFDEIANYSPDLVVPLHFFLPKLFDAFTIGCMWNPTYAIEQNKAWDNLRSYDGYGVASDHQQELVKALKFRSPYPYFLTELFPSTNASEFNAPSVHKEAVYIGSNWDQRRHKQFFLGARSVRVFGPKDQWEDLINQGILYQGEIPFDGRTALKTYNEYGIGLALHHAAHNDEGIPNMRPFEIAASGAIMIADQNSFVKKVFGDNVLYVDSKIGGENLAEQVENHVAWIINHPNQAIEMASECNKIFNKDYSLEKILKSLLEKLDDYKSDVTTLPKTNDIPVEILIRSDGNQKSKLYRAINSIQNQSYKNVSVRIIYRGSEEFLPSLKIEIQEIFPKFKVDYTEAYQPTDRGSQFFIGLRNSQAEFIGFLDHDDVLFKDHVKVLLSILTNDQDIALAYSGSVRVWEGGVPPEGEDERKLAFFYGLTEKSGLKAVIVSNSYIVRRGKIPWQVFSQPIPRMETKSDYVFLELLINNGRRFVFSEKVTCAFYWRASRQDNCAFDLASNIQGKVARETIVRPTLTTMGYAQPQIQKIENPKTIIGKLKTYIKGFFHG